MLGVRGPLSDQENHKTGDQKRESERETRAHLKPGLILCRQVISLLLNIPWQRVVDHPNRGARRSAEILQKSIRHQINTQRHSMKRLVIKERRHIDLSVARLLIRGRHHILVKVTEQIDASHTA